MCYTSPMTTRTTMNVSLTPELERFVNEQVASGRYQSASEVFRDGLRLLQQRAEDRQAALEEVRRKVREGLEASARGEVVDSETALRDFKAEAHRRSGRLAGRQ